VWNGTYVTAFLMQTLKPQVRLMQSCDFQDIRRIYKIAIEEYTEFLEREERSEKLSKIIARKYLDSYQKTQSSYVALIKGKLVGFILSRVIECVNGHERVLWLDYIVVDPEYRRKGVASLLVNKARDYARKTRVDEIFATSNIDNEPSKRLLMKSGFSVRDWRIASLLV
jgi:ribosomal protein S18 acetylase RimI-like enzyme